MKYFISVRSGALIHYKAEVGNGAIIDSNATINTGTIIGNDVMIGEEAFIGHLAKIHNNVVIGSKAFVGENIIIHESRKVESESVTLHQYGYIASLHFGGFRDVFETSEFYKKIMRNFLIGSYFWLANVDEYEMFTALYVKVSSYDF